MATLQISTEFVNGIYDETDQILKIYYHKLLDSSVTSVVYAWLAEIMKHHPELLSTTQGVIFDFSDVRKFDLENLVTANQESVSLNSRYTMSHLPVALVVKTRSQEDYVSLTMKVTPEEERKRVVKTVEEALTFITDFQKRQAEQRAAAESIEETLEEKHQDT